MDKFPQTFKNIIVDENRINELDNMSAPRSRYIIAMTPRSGSSYLCDVMINTKRFGTPGEVLNQNFIPSIIKKFPGRTPEAYLQNVIRGRKTHNGLSGLKASWFQFNNFVQILTDRSYLDGFKYIYLTRRDISAQAISLYKATKTNVFHTNIDHGAEEISKLDSLEYSYDGILNWYEHIVKQEKGWKEFFFENRIFPLCISYEDIEDDILLVMKRIATFVGVLPENVSLPEEDSVFKKIRDSRNLEWAHRFNLEHCVGR